MRALDRKLLRDLRLMWSQALTIALVVASGLGGFLTSLSAVDSLALARERFYAEGHFADVFAQLKRAPLSLVPRLHELPGVMDAQTTLEQMVRIQLPGVDEPITGQLIGMDLREPQRLNRVFVKTGRMPQARTGAGGASAAGGEGGHGALEVLVSQAFAKARQLQPGSRLSALINGRQRELLVVGTALSPEYIFAGFAGMPDMRGFGIFWLDREQLAAAYDMRGAFNRVAIKLAPQARVPDTLSALDSLLAPYGGREAHGRATQLSHLMLDNEIKEQQVLGSLLPAIFLGVAAFLLNVVVSRLVSTQREQIAALKALGYPGRSIAAHYLKMVLAIVSLGLLLGLLLGDVLGGLLTGLYADFFQFLHFEHRLAPELLLVSVAVTVLMAGLGALNAILATLRLAPAEAMRPAAPGRYRRSLAERLPLLRHSLILRMILRQVQRHPWRTGLSVGGVAVAVAIVVLGNFFRDAIDHIVNMQFSRIMRGDVVVHLAEPSGDAVRLALARLPGVLMVESGRDVPVRLSHGPQSERVLLQGHTVPGLARRIIDVNGLPHEPGRDGLVITDRLARKLGLGVGDWVRVETLEGRERQLLLPVEATVSEMIGLNAYIERRTLNRLLGEGDVSSQFSLVIERDREPELMRALAGLPRVAGIFSKATMTRNMQEISARNVRIMSTILTLFASVIAVGVVYNNARIALAERSWELASLRVLGFTRAEVSGLLLGEMALTTLLALPLGMALGLGLCHALVGALASDQFMFPVVVLPRTYALAALAVLLAGLASALVVRRRVDRLDMVAALKTRE